MDLQELMNAEVTCSYHTSEAMVLEIMYREDWRCYSTNTTEKIDYVIERFLKNHAKIPGFISKEVYATIPAQVFHWIDDHGSYKGGLFLNGAVLVAHQADGQTVKSLFIEEVTAQRYLYPGEEHYMNMGRKIREGLESLRDAETNEAP